MAAPDRPPRPLYTWDKALDAVLRSLPAPTPPAQPATGPRRNGARR